MLLEDRSGYLQDNTSLSECPNVRRQHADGVAAAPVPPPGGCVPPARLTPAAPPGHRGVPAASRCPAPAELQLARDVQSLQDVPAAR